ncbi:MAG TPA: aldolase/citrate lyase family protein [bacterium]|nr:aldolase/citrate lyase family protein [bacterium]
MTPNRAKARLREGAVAIGTMVSELRTEEVAHLLAAAGFDFFVIDTEHASANWETVQTLSRAARSTGIAPLVRVTDNVYALTARALDAGALGVMVPHVETAADAREIVRCVKYPPDGERGFGLRPALTEYGQVSHAQAMAWSNAETLVLAQIESGRALDNLDDIAAVPGIDVLLIGPNDLSVSLGVPGDLMHQKMQDAYRHVAEVAARHGIAGGVHPGDLKVVERGHAAGMRCLMFSSDIRMLLGAARQAAQALRALSPGPI